MNQTFMLVHVSDCLADTRHLTAEQNGAYMLLLMAMWKAGGELPNDEKQLSRIVLCSPARWEKIRGDVMELFVVDGDRVSTNVFDRWSREHNRLLGRRPLSAALRSFILERDGFRCAYCLDEVGPFEVDHVHPVSRGGGDDKDNLVCACRGCNRAKSAMTVEEWGYRK